MHHINEFKMHVRFLVFKPLIIIIGYTIRFISEKQKATVFLHSNFEP
ncbi:MAG: hypothetical protein K0S26_1359 [Bacteroidota bacterium]|jgi:hypothetical protein|nr:hypothetical protein [Bacteroidota bacterium]